MSTQNFQSHRRWVPMYHFVLFAVTLATLIGSVINLTNTSGEGLYSASLLVAVTFALLLLFYFTRAFSLKAQDRAIRAEENLRHFAMTGKLLDPRITTRQIVGLRFASDGEFVALAERAASDGLSEDDIKKAIQNWRADTYRV